MVSFRYTWLNQICSKLRWLAWVGWRVRFLSNQNYFAIIGHTTKSTPHTSDENRLADKTLILYQNNEEATACLCKWKYLVRIDHRLKLPINWMRWRFTNAFLTGKNWLCIAVSFSRSVCLPVYLFLFMCVCACKIYCWNSIWIIRMNRKNK